jgi:AcrR family transcriptional regulator
MLERRKRSDGLETMRIVIEHARAELDQHGPVEFNLDRVLEVSKVSRSSVYHHFGNRAGLIAAAEIQDSLEQFRRQLDTIRAVLDDSSTSEEMLATLEVALAADGVPNSRRRRQRRIADLAVSQSNEMLNYAMAATQVDGTRELALILADGVERGLIWPEVPLDGIAYWLQSVLVGRILVDLANDPQLDDDWVATAMAAIRAVLCPPR